MSLLELSRGLIAPSEPAAKHELERLQALVLLGGAMRSSSLSEATGRSPLDLPIDDRHTLLDLWQAHAMVFATFAELNHLPVRMITSGSNPARSNEKSILLSVEQDPSEMRGTGGLLRDIAEAYPDDSLIAVANASQILYDALSQLLPALAAAKSDVALVAHDDGAPSSVLLARCGALRVIPSIGYVDMKEQALPLIARHWQVKVIRRPHAVGLPVRTLADYIRALRRYHRRVPLENGFEEDWSPIFSIRESGSEVDSSAKLHDSIVLRGGRVDAGAVLVRSVVCDGAVVRKNQCVIDRLVVSKR